MLAINKQQTVKVKVQACPSPYGDKCDAILIL